MSYPQSPRPIVDRRQLRRGSFVFLLGGVVFLLGALLLPGVSDDFPTTPVKPGVAVRLPDLGIQRKVVVLIGATEPTVRIGPGLALYGCAVDQPQPPSVPLTDDVAPLKFPDPVAGRRMYALVDISDYADGSTLTCSGPKAQAAQPMYLIGGKSGLDPGARVFFGMCGVLFGSIGLVLRLVSGGRR